MLRASGVDIRLTAEDLAAALAGRATGRVEVVGVELAPGMMTVRLKAAVDKLPVAVPVDLRFDVRRAEGSVVELGVTWANMGLLPGFVKEAALQKAFEALPGEYKNGLFTIDVTEVTDSVPVQFDLAGVTIASDGVRVSLRNVMAYPLEPIAVLVEPVEGALVPAPSRTEHDLPEHQDYYQKLRARVRQFATEKAPRWLQPLVPWVLAVPDFFVLMVRLAKDPRVPAMVKVMVGVVIAYFISPIDLIPDPIPLVGEVDDVAVALFALEQLTTRLEPAIIEENWPGEGKVLDLVKEGVQLFRRVLPGKMIDSIKRLLAR
jgi:uncharacterized membrane protein YkvA (DUF1232 family)